MVKVQLLNIFNFHMMRQLRAKRLKIVRVVSVPCNGYRPIYLRCFSVTYLIIVMYCLWCLVKTLMRISLA